MKKNLIYMCPFLQRDQMEMCWRLIQTLFLQNSLVLNPNQDTLIDILILTSKEFEKPLTESLSVFDTLSISIHVLENVHSTFDAGCSRLQIFSYPRIQEYEKILYLDTDILINSPIHALFQVTISPSHLYGLEEGWLGHEFWGGSRFFDFSAPGCKLSGEDRGFSSGILLFWTDEKIRLLFEKILAHIQSWKGPYPQTMDQPFINYNAIIGGQSNNKLLLSTCELYPEPSAESTERLKKIIYHFPGGKKLARMHKYIPSLGKLFISRVLHMQNLVWAPDRNAQRHSFLRKILGRSYGWFSNSPSEDTRKEGVISFSKEYSSEDWQFRGTAESPFGKCTWETLDQPSIMKMTFGGHAHFWVWNQEATSATSVRETDAEFCMAKVERPLHKI